MLRVRRPSATVIDRLLAEARGARPTYSEVGQTRAEQLPSGYRHDRYERRLVYVDEEPERFAFAYGTLPGHPERGEAAFRIERDGTGDVFFRVVSFSRTVDPLARLASPVTRLIQQRVTTRYLDAIAAASGPPG